MAITTQPNTQKPTKPKWWQPGGSGVKPSYLQDNVVNVSEFIKTADKANAPLWKNEYNLINQRNDFYTKNKDLTKAPKYSFTEAARLYGYGYAGVFGRSTDHQTVGLVGEAWQQAYALDALRKNRDILSFSIVDTQSGVTREDLSGLPTAVEKQVMAADQSAKTWNNLFTLYNNYQEMGGDAGYAKRYGKGMPPSADSKYGILNHVNDKSIRADDVQATYQASLVAQTKQASKIIDNIIADNPQLASLSTYADLLKFAGSESSIDTTKKIGKADQAKIKRMEDLILGIGPVIDKTVQTAMGGTAPSLSKEALMGAAWIVPGLGPGVAGLAATDFGAQIINDTLNKINSTASDQLSPTAIDWGTWAGIPGIARNIVTGIARFGAGMVPGVFAATDEGLIAAKDAAEVAKGDKAKFGDGIDYKLGDAMWTSFAERYYDPFAYKATPDGKQVFQGFKTGLQNREGWKAFGNKAAQDPVAYALDVASIIPVIGFAARVGEAAAIATKLSSSALRTTARESISSAEGVTAEAAARAASATANAPIISVENLTTTEHLAWLDAHNAWLASNQEAFAAARDYIMASPEQAAAEARVSAAKDLGMDPSNPNFPTTPLNDLNSTWANRATHGVEPVPADFAMPRILESAQSILDSVNARPELLDILDRNQIETAARLVEDNAATKALTDAEAALVTVKDAYRSVPSVRSFRRIARRAMAGDYLATRQMNQWKALGYDFNNAENNLFLRAAAKFEPRTRILEAPPENIVQSSIARITLPGSPLARGLKESTLWFGKYVVDPALKGSVAKRLFGKGIDFPRLGYAWNYTKAVADSLHMDWGDVATEMQFAAENYVLDANSNLTNDYKQAILSEVYGGSGEVATNAPILRRQLINAKLDSITIGGRFKQDPLTDAITTKFIPGSEDQATALLAARETLLAEEMGTITERAAAFDEYYSNARGDLRRRIANPEYKSGDVNLDAARELHDRLQRMHDNRSTRIVHSDTSPSNVEYLRHLYSEAMASLKILPKDLFGEDGLSGKIGEYTKDVVRLNGSIIPHINGLYGSSDEAIIYAAQHRSREGTVFDALDADKASVLKENWISFIRKITDPNSNVGIFRRGDSPADVEAAPVVVLSKSQKGVPAGFSRVHIPELRQSLDKGSVNLGKIIDKKESYVIPNEALVVRRLTKKTHIVTRLSEAEGNAALESGALNAMSDIYPSARFYSEKVSETGLKGVRANSAELKNEHVVATSGLREHSIAVAVRSEINYYKARMQDSIISQAEESAVLVPASSVVGKTSAKSGYHILRMVRTFSTLEEARAFANLRGVGKQFDEAMTGDLSLSESIATAPEGLSKINIGGEEQYIVRGSVNDWAANVGNEDIYTHSIMSDYKQRNFDDPNDIGNRGMVLAIPNVAERKLSMMVIEGNTYANRILDNTWAKKSTSLFKDAVLNFRFGFIDANVIGGTSMLMMHNPMAAAKMLGRLFAKNAKLSGSERLASWAGDSAAVDRVLAYEQNHNIYRSDTGIGIGSTEAQNLGDFSSKSAWIKKYIRNGGYTTVAAFERIVRNAVAIDFLTSDASFISFMRGPEVAKYIREGIDYSGVQRPMDGPNPITHFEAATDILLDRNSIMFNPELKHRMRYVTNTVSGNYHQFSAFETMLRNFAMPFYAWQRHSVAYTWRMAVDKPLTANALYNIGQHGYNQVSAQGLPDYLRQTIPVPTVLKPYLGVLPSDFVIDASNINPFGTSTNMLSAFYGLVSGDNVAGNVFQFANPYLNMIIKDQLGVDPVSGRIDWARLNGDNNGAGIWDSTLGMFGKIGQGTWLGSAGKIKDVVDNAYHEDSLSNQYPAIQSQEDALRIIKNMYTTDAQGNPVSKGLKGWQLSIPNDRVTSASSRSTDIVNAFGFKSYLINSENLNDQSRTENVAAMALAFYNNKKLADAAASDINSVDNYKAKANYVMQVWLPAAQAQNVDPAIIQLVLTKLGLEKPKGGRFIDPKLYAATIGG